jgi:hypothetical protein
MSSVYQPDAWVILRIEDGGEVIHKVLGGWYGGYLGANSWRLNSGITRIEKDAETYSIYGYSGSVYRVHESNQRMNMLMASIFASMRDRADVRVVDIAEVMT